MNAPQQVVISPDAEQKMQEALKLQRESYLAEGFVSLDVRKDRIDRANPYCMRCCRRGSTR